MPSARVMRLSLSATRATTLLRPVQFVGNNLVIKPVTAVAHALGGKDEEK